MGQHYTSTGKFSSLSFILWILVALTVLPLLAGLYAYAIWYIPIPYLNLFITGIFGYVIGLVMSKTVIKFGKVRNGKLAFVFCLFAALTALYVHWAVWIDLAYNISGTIGDEDLGVAKSNIKITEVLNLVLQPNALFGIMSEINEVGIWGIKGGTVSGGLLTFIWVVEILMVTLIAIVVGSGQSQKPFCEEENIWFQEKSLSPVSLFADGPALVKALSIGDMEVLNEVLKPAGDTKSQSHAKMKLYDAKSGENFVSISNEIAQDEECQRWVIQLCLSFEGL